MPSCASDLRQGDSAIGRVSPGSPGRERTGGNARRCSGAVGGHNGEEATVSVLSPTIELVLTAAGPDGAKLGSLALCLEGSA